MNTHNNKNNIDRFLDGLTTPKEEQELLDSNNNAEKIIVKAGNDFKRNQLSDERFDEMMSFIEESHTKKTKTLRLQFYSVAASVVLFLAAGGFWGFKHFEQSMQQQYAQADAALQQVAYYINKAQAPLQNVEYMNKSLDKISNMSKGQKQIEKMDVIKYYPVK